MTLTEFDSLCGFINQIEEESANIYSISIETMTNGIGQQTRVFIQTSPEKDEGVYRDVSDVLTW
jgi:hypothetical protein